ncbi:HNH endonuclease [Solibacillus sp. FSL K6-1554]|uniref:HNH endonuclease n=1 Tax=Solibacillus sp. FSL K6-1554 TaxID=2921472 RepID=UPI0030F4E91C
MKNLLVVQRRPIKVYNDITNRTQLVKRRVLLRGKLNVYLRYREYNRNKNELVITQPLDYRNNETLKKYLISCYGKNATLNKLKKEIKEVQEVYYQAHCPYCEINEPGTFDHYLPKEEFPEYSVLSLNLIPCCSICNSYKGELWENSNSRVFLNYYFDEIPQEQFLYAKLDYTDGTDVPKISFELRNDNGIDSSIFQRIETHFDKLYLLKRYIKQANSKVSSIRKSCILKINGRNNIVAVKSILEDDLDVLEQQVGCNNWEYALVKSVLESDEFWDNLI